MFFDIDVAMRSYRDDMPENSGKIGKDCITSVIPGPEMLLENIEIITLRCGLQIL